MSVLGVEFFRRIKTQVWLFEGPDAQRFLNGISTVHLSRTVSDHSALGGRGLFLDPKGKLLAPFIFLKESDQKILLRLDIGNTLSETSSYELHQSLFDHIAALIIADDLSIKAVHTEILQGWDAKLSRDELSSALPALRKEAQDLLFPVKSNPIGFFIPIPHLGVHAFELWPNEFKQLPDLSGHELSHAETEQRFFAAKYLSFPDQLLVGDLPLEFGFSDAISFFKGCYRGQEIIARVTYRGKIVKGLCLLRFAGPLGLSDKLLVNKADQVVGEVRALSEGRDQALAVLRFDAESVVTNHSKVPIIETQRLVDETNALFR
jgi:folate-binding protein YgfZ